MCGPGTTQGQSSSWAVPVPSPASTRRAAAAPLGQARCALTLRQKRFFCWRGVRRALTDPYLLGSLPANGLFELLLYAMNTPHLSELYQSYYSIYTLFLLSRHSSELQEGQTSLLGS